jgi:hypothetical protein
MPQQRERPEALADETIQIVVEPDLDEMAQLTQVSGRGRRKRPLHDRGVVGEVELLGADTRQSVRPQAEADLVVLVE